MLDATPSGRPDHRMLTIGSVARGRPSRRGLTRSTRRARAERRRDASLRPLQVKNQRLRREAGASRQARLSARGRRQPRDRRPKPVGDSISVACARPPGAVPRRRIFGVRVDTGHRAVMAALHCPSGTGRWRRFWQIAATLVVCTRTPKAVRHVACCRSSAIPRGPAAPGHRGCLWGSGARENGATKMLPGK